MRNSALGGACAMVVGLAALAAGLYYDQSHLAQWTHFAPSPNLTKGVTQMETARVFTLLGAMASAFAAAIAAGSTLLAGLSDRSGRWVLRLIAVLLLVVMLLIAVAVAVGSFTGEEPVAVIETPWWLLGAEWAALGLAVVGAGTTTAQLWRFVPEDADEAADQAAE
jgi:MFS family permease